MIKIGGSENSLKFLNKKLIEKREIKKKILLRKIKKKNKLNSIRGIQFQMQ